MTHRAEDIMEAVKTNLAGLVTTGANVHRAFEHMPQLPALVIVQGSDGVAAMQYGEVSRTLTITVEARIKKSATAATSLNAIHAEVYSALMADVTQGLGFVERTEPVSADAPTQKDLEIPIVSQSLNFRVHYQHATKTVEG